MSFCGHRHVRWGTALLGLLSALNCDDAARPLVPGPSTGGAGGGAGGTAPPVEQPGTGGTPISPEFGRRPGPPAPPSSLGNGSGPITIPSHNPLARTRAVLDHLGMEYRDLAGRVPAADRPRVERHLEGLRELERRLAASM